LSTDEWAQYLDTEERPLLRRTRLRHISDSTWCSDVEAETLNKVAAELATIITRREVQDLRTAEESGSWRWPRLQRGND
jgi:membrane protein YdbS with pleckstrin-like domain